MTDKLKDRYASLTLLSLCIISWFFLIPYGIEGAVGMREIGPDFFPRFITLAVFILSIFLLIKSILQIEDKQDDEKEKKKETTESNSKPWAGLSVFLIMFGYIYLADMIGYLYSSIISMAMIMWVLSVRKWYLYIVIIAIIFLIQYVFQNVLYIRLP
ncbi:hypothetical protein D7Z54_09855 [Salibacterium salarium]|uniref:DUF1468 domain-containing protein n=1 Tax=Salibacterium salarium TaxID=284579 RepID=A0A428N5J1_9BACI|nr:tripartite tricarboxylate transporter TctB family protein [Salibacterium salarium]RSL33606.1 hypothetical protein D7Z54_09855 [Salibacterium salarium]